MKHAITTTIVLLAVIMIAGCRKTSREIIWHGGKPDTVIIGVKKVETIKDADRDGVYYKDVFYIENKYKATYIGAKHDATFDIGMLSNIIYESTTTGEQVTVLRRQKNVIYKLRTYWNVPNMAGEYLYIYSFTSTGE